MPWVAGWLGLGHDSNGAIQTFRILQLIAMDSHKMLHLTVHFAFVFPTMAHSTNHGVVQVWARSRLVGQKSTAGPMYVFATPISALTGQMQQLFMLCLFSSFASPGQGLAFQIQHGGWHPTPAWLAFRASDHTQSLPPTGGRGGWPTHPQGGRGVKLSCPGQVQTFSGGGGEGCCPRDIYMSFEALIGDVYCC